MTTAVRPSNGQTWAEVFPYPDGSPFWSVINQELEMYALFGRFGANFLPHDFQQDEWYDTEKCNRCDKPKKEHPIELSLSQIVALSAFDSYVKHDPFRGENIDPNAAYEEIKKSGVSAETFRFFQVGIWMYYHWMIARLNPEVGHFVGRGKEHNEEDADRFLNNG